MRIALTFLAVALAGCATPGVRVEAPPGVVQRTIPVEIAGDTSVVDIYRPEARRAEAVVLLAHGFSRNRSTLAELATELTVAGFTVVVPDLPYFADSVANARFLGSLAATIKQRIRPDLDFGAQRIVFAGFSAGATASLVAASTSDALGWIGLDPVDQGGAASEFANGLRAPAFVVRASPSSCNANYNFQPALARLPDLVANRVEPGASHCDFEAPTDAVCALVCGPASAERQRAIRAAVVAAARAIAAP